MFRSAVPPAVPSRGWWNRPWLLALLVALAAVPLAWPVTPPFIDLPEHMGRYRIELAPAGSLLRTTYFSFQWHYLANLGVDLLIVPFAALFGLELGLKLIVIAMPVLTATGILWIAREAHGRVPPTALFALPLVYNFALIWGFLNYVLAMALALNAYALWLRLGRQERFRARAAWFVPIGLLLTTAHVFGWAVLGLLAFAAEAVRARDAGAAGLAGRGGPLDPRPRRPCRGRIARFGQAVWRGGLACLPLLPPVLLLLVWRSGDAAGRTAIFFAWTVKWVYLVAALRGLDLQVDLASVWVLFGLVLAALVGFGVRFNRTLGWAAVLLGAAYLLLPRILLGSAYADMRLAAYLLLMLVVAIVPRLERRGWSGVVAGTAIALYAGRIALLTADFAARDRDTQHQLAALDLVRPGSRVFVEVALPCLSRWSTTRRDHLGAMAIVRRGAFANGQWTDPGAQLVRIRYAPARGYAEDPTEILRPFRCRQRGAKLYPQALNALPRDAFDYVWLVDLPRRDWRSFPGLVPIWTGGRSGILYRVEAGSATRPIETPAGHSPRTAA